MGGAGAGGLEPKEAMRRAALARAEAKADPNAEWRMKEELVGRLTELYARRGQTIPFNVGALGLPQLRKLHEEMSRPKM